MYLIYLIYFVACTLTLGGQVLQPIFGVLISHLLDEYSRSFAYYLLLCPTVFGNPKGVTAAYHSYMCIAMIVVVQGKLNCY